MNLCSLSSSSSRAAVAAAAAAIALKFHPKHVTNKNKTKHSMKISHINVNIYDKTATSQQNSD
jgi:Tfp pilus assembly major pilin PilA